MKKFSGLIVIIAIIVALLLIYTGFWFYQAHRVKELAVYHLNEYEKTDPEGYHYKVDDVSVHGYPFAYVIKLDNPRYESASDSEDKLRIILNGALKIGTDIFGKSYWLKQEGDLNYKAKESVKNFKNYVVKGNTIFKFDVAHPQYAQAFMHPFRGLPKVFYEENPSFVELLSEIQKASYEDDNFGLYETNDQTQKQLVGFSKGKISWDHESKGNENEKFVLNFDLKDFEAEENGKYLLPHLKKLMDLNQDMSLNIPYVLGSGKNNITLAFEATFPKQFDVWRFFNYKDIDLQLAKFEIENFYGHTLMQFDLGLKETEKDNRNLHLNFNTESIITEKGSEAIHRQFIDGLKLQVTNQPNDPENKVLADLLKCCEDRLQDIIPNYTKLGKLQFIFNTDIKVKNVSQNAALDKIVVNSLDLLTEPYGIKSHGSAEIIHNEPSGKYEINWINYKEMIHDMISYFNQIHPILVKFSEVNKQSFPLGPINEEQENEIVDFFKSISDTSSKEKATITITIDFTDMHNPKIGPNSVEEVKAAWDKLSADILKPEKQAVPSEAPKTEEKAK